jgi:hypothetical protein
MPVVLETAGRAYAKLEAIDQDPAMHAMMLLLTCVLHLLTTEFSRATAEAQEHYNIRSKISPDDDARMVRACTVMARTNISAGHYDVGLEWLVKVDKLLNGALGKDTEFKVTWGLNASRNHYLLGEYDKADSLLSNAIGQAEKMKSWYVQVR